MEQEYLLEMKNISKKYGEHQVLKDVNLKIKPGEIHCLLGENGAGKSTLMNILFGMTVIHSSGGFEGKIQIDGKKANMKSPKEAIELGIGMVHQEFMLIPSFTITENIKLNREILKDNVMSKVFGKNLKTVDFKTMNKDARKALDTIDMNIDEWVQVAGLPVGHKQFIEIAREIDKSNIKLLVFDEPTAVLTESEASSLLKSMKRLAKAGIGILFITHRLDEVLEVSDNVTILRDGELVANKATKDTSVEEIAELMVGRKVGLDSKEIEEEEKETLLSLKNFSVNMPGEEVYGIDLEIKKGEILGIGGLAGQGKIGISNGIMGMYPSTGEMKFNGEKLDVNNTSQMLEKRFAFMSEDRKGVGLILDETIELNIVFTALKVNGRFLKRYGFFEMQDLRAIKKYCEKMIKVLDIRCTGGKQHAGSLSGGNQQKICIARVLAQEPDILLVSEPTRGIDIGAKELILDLLVKLNKEKGMTIIMTSSELAELRSISDRIAIISEGKLSGILKPRDSDRDFGLIMSGKTLEEIHYAEEV